MKRSVRALLRDAGLSALSVLVTLLVLEAYFRHREPHLEKLPARLHVDPAPPVPGVFSVLGIGESSMVGEPYDPSSFAELVSLELRHSHPGVRTETRLVARQGATLNDLLASALQAISYHPSLVILLAGHNDFLGEIAHHASCAPGGDRMYELLRGSALFRFVHSRFLRRGIGSAPDFRERALFDQPIVCRPQWDDLLERYRALAATIARACHDAGVPAVLVFPAGNEVELNPNRSTYEGAPERRVEFESEYRAGTAAFLRGDLGEARRRLERAASIDRSFAELAFVRGRLALALGDTGGAAADFAAAREHDAFPWRALDEQRSALSEAASRYGVGFVDARSAIAAASPSGMLDSSVFHDIHHPSLTGYLALSRAVVASLESQAPAGLPPRVSARPLTEADVLSARGFTVRDTFRLFETRALWFRGFADLTFEPSTRLLALLDNVAALRSIDAVHASEVLGPGFEADARRRLSDALRPYGVDADAMLARRTSLLERYPYLPREDTAPVHLGEVPSFIRLGEGEIADDRSSGGGPLTVRGVAQRGFSTVPPSDVAFRLGGHYSRMTITVATADGAPKEARASCKATGDARVLFDAPGMTTAEPPRVLSLDVRGVQELHLTCTKGAHGGPGASPVAWISPGLEALP